MTDRVRSQLLRDAEASLIRAALALSFAEDQDRARRVQSIAKEVEDVRTKGEA